MHVTPMLEVSVPFPSLLCELGVQAVRACACQRRWDAVTPRLGKLFGLRILKWRDMQMLLHRGKYHGQRICTDVERRPRQASGDISTPWRAGQHRYRCPMVFLYELLLYILIRVVLGRTFVHRTHHSPVSFLIKLNQYSYTKD